VYLPGKGIWYDFWTGKNETPGRHVEAAAPVETMLLYILAGSVIPMGPLVQYVAEKPADPIELRIYRGDNGTFTLYEDEGDTYHYEKGVYATIPITWNDATKTLTLGKRKGEFPGMLKERTFNVVFVNENHGTGVGVTERADQSVSYSGQAISVTATKGKQPR
jgi:alpha-D-xyloside xylohydrolase